MQHLGQWVTCLCPFPKGCAGAAPVTCMELLSPSPGDPLPATGEQATALLLWGHCCPQHTALCELLLQGSPVIPS